MTLVGWRSGFCIGGQLVSQNEDLCKLEGSLLATYYMYRQFNIQQFYVLPRQ